jgi:long-chain acyl-CoA synthetase
MNIAQNVERGARFFPNKAALVFESRSITYQELDCLASRLAGGLSRLGVKKGDRVALFLPNIPEFVISYLGILKVGAVSVSVNAMLKSGEVKFILRDCGAKALVTTEKLRNNVPDQELPDLNYILIAEGKSRQDISLEELIAGDHFEPRAIAMNRDEPAAIVYTSGTTGFPKGATLSHGNVISNMYAKNRCCRMQPEDRLLLFLPLFHCFGQNAILNSGLNACATIVLQRRFKPEQVLETIERDRITMFFGVPTVYLKLLAFDTSSYNLKSVRYYFTAAAPMPVEVVQRWQKKYNLTIHEGYGLTETSPFACYNHDLKYKLGSIGTPIENVEMKLVDPNGMEVSPGALGEILVRGPNVMLGYWNRPVETAQVFSDGWFHTGDLGCMDEDGYFYLVDRIKDTINVSGFKVYPAEVENILYAHPAVAEVAVYGIANPLKGEIVKADILLKTEFSVTQEELLEFCSQKLAVYKIPHTINFVEFIPKNTTGKVLKKVLRDQAVVAK